MGSRDRVIRWYLIVAGAVPALVVAASVALQASWRDRLPDPVAIHWGVGGGPDGFGSAGGVLVLTAVLGLALPALMLALTLPSLLRGARGATYRFMGAFALGMTVFLSVLQTWSVGMQRDLADAADAGDIGWPLAAGLAAGLVAGGAGWVLQPRQRAVVPGLVAPDALTLAPGEQAAWMRTTTLGRGMRVLLGSVVGALGVLTVVTWALAGRGAGLMTLGTLALVLLALAATATFHVSVDARGLTVVSALGWPRLHVAAADVESAGVAPVSGFGEFGGYGVRVRPGATGVVLRDGDSLQVVRRGGRRLVVTVDDAATAAALLTALAQRAEA